MTLPKGKDQPELPLWLNIRIDGRVEFYGSRKAAKLATVGIEHMFKKIGYKPRRKK